MTTRTSKAIGIAIGSLALWGSAALAGDPQDPGTGFADAADAPLLVIEAAETAPEVLSLEELSEARGGTSIVVNNQTLTAITSGNSIDDYLAGTINLSDNALSSFSGVGNFLFNTGAQNSLQTGMTLTITIE